MELVVEKYKQTEVGVIPSDWEVKTLGEIGVFKNGINKSSEDFGFGYPFVNLMDVFGRTSISQNESFGLINSNDVERKLYELKKGDVLFIRSSVKPSGVGLTCVIENNLPNIVFSGFIIRYRDDNYLDEGYKKHCFYDERFRNNLIGSSTVSANTNINQEALKKLKIPLPPTKAEQTLIATALSDADALISSLEKLIAKKRNIKQGAMQQLLIDNCQLSIDNGGWEVKKLGDVCDFSSGTAHENFIDERGNYVVVNSKFVSTNGEVRKFANILFCPAKIGDILIVLSDVPNGKAIAKCFLVDKEDFYTVNQRIGIIKPFQNISSDFLYFLINRHPYLLAFDDGAKQTNLRNQDVNGLPLAIPKSKKEQTRIATILSDMDAEITALETKLEKYKKVKLGMMQNLLTGKIRLV